MDELDALKLLKGEKPTAAEESGESKSQPQKSDIYTYLKAAVIGFLLLTALYYIILHPVDRLAIKFALNDSYVINTEAKTWVSFVPGSTIEVDGNIIRQGDTYYEIGEETSYVYRKGTDEKWYRNIYYPEQDDSLIFIAEDLIDRSNYTRGFFPWSPMEYNKPFEELENVTVQVTAGKCIISGTTDKFNGLYNETVYVTIEIKFGFVNLELPENYTVN